MKLRFLGDIHGDFKFLYSVYGLEKEDRLIQVGDLGVGFTELTNSEKIDNFIDIIEEVSDIKISFIRGNHDNPNECEKMKHFIPDGYVEIINDTKIMYIGGASSIDKAWRTPMINWWPNEEISEEKLEQLIINYEKFKPDILVTHDTYERYARNKMIPLVNGIKSEASRTRLALEKMYEIQPPKIHIFGHWHVSLDEIDPITETRMICLNINDIMDLKI